MRYRHHLNFFLRGTKEQINPATTESFNLKIGEIFLDEYQTPYKIESFVERSLICKLEGDPCFVEIKDVYCKQLSE